METETQKFLEAEETAMKLISTLQKLNTEATSYQTATHELDTVRKRLVGLVEATQNIAKESHEVVKTLRNIGGPAILNRLAQVEKRITEDSSSQAKAIARLNVLVALTLAGTVGAIVVYVIALVR